METKENLNSRTRTEPRKRVVRDEAREAAPSSNQGSNSGGKNRAVGSRGSVLAVSRLGKEVARARTHEKNTEDTYSTRTLLRRTNMKAFHLKTLESATPAGRRHPEINSQPPKIIYR